MRPCHPSSNSSFRTLQVLWVIVLSASLAIAQTRPIAFPHAASTGTQGNWIPLGEVCSPYGSSFAESRTQILIPAEFLPPHPGSVWALEHCPTSLSSPTYPCANIGSTVQYAMLEITLAHRPRGAGALSTTFAANLPTPPPMPVFPAQPITIRWTLGNWNAIPFSQPFHYNGTDDLVVEIRKVVTPTGQNVGTRRNLDPVRADLPRPVLASSTPGSGGANALTGAHGNPLGWRLRFDQQAEPSLEVIAPLGSRGHYTGGDAMQFRIYAISGDPFVVAVSFGFLPVPVVVTSIQGGIWLAPPLTIVSTNVVAPAPGTSFHRSDLTIPPNPSLADLLVTAQSGVVELTTGQLHMTNAVDFVIR